MEQICVDIEAETAALAAVVSGLTEDQWRAPTVAEGWDSHETILHLGATDWACYLAVTDPASFVDARERLSKGEVSVHELVGSEIKAKLGGELWAWFLDGRTAMIDALRNVNPKARVTWLGPTIGARSLATSRLLETWTHSHDLADTFDVEYPQTDRLRHIAHIGYVTREFSYINRDMTMPDEPVRLELTSPNGDLWIWGPDEAEEVVISSAYEFCKVLTRRTPLRDSKVQTKGVWATEWMEIAQPWIEPPRISDQA
ncbi:MAG: maleylpyruvate isomerase family mycothiol-dependent enzyme [Actinomycetota bacterium]|nr:TIGR03084 family protein [Acidimicrobiaceae bacterium]MEC7916258.1 maleylpyruvate isomerase family mycothiol-dependent enzyme [Actinomycetota bacterium]MEC9058577.1 maleylpyruvate isomerase family mycothiol-dependent enzyme [Actinomycetota bacterium]MED5361328.1 maleylpyruvate isomerase family mycothiol-dependent enzyme [Actinomycetota bacterium]